MALNEHLHPADHPARIAGLASQRAVEAGDGEAWVALFTPDGSVADPVGVSPLDPEGKGHNGQAAIKQFYDTFIANGTVRFDYTKSYAAGDECAFVGSLSTTFPDGRRSTCELVAVYRVDEAGKLVSLRSFWEFDKMVFDQVDPAEANAS